MFEKRDLVCNAPVTKRQAFKHEYNGRIYYFDSLACKTTFSDNPESFIKRFSFKKLFSGIFKDHGPAPKSCHEMKKPKS